MGRAASDLRRVLPGLLLICAALLAGCGEEAPADNAVEAQEQNTVELGPVRYRAVLFRQLNIDIPPGSGGSPFQSASPGGMSMLSWRKRTAR